MAALPKIITKPVRILKNISLDLRYSGRFLGGTTQSRFSHLGAKETANTSYEALDSIFDYASPRPDDVIVDVGCGKGRVLSFFIRKKYPNRIIGIELDPQIAEQTRKNMEKYSNIEVLNADICDKLPLDGTIFYMYNPFNGDVMKRFTSLIKPLASADRPLLLYYNSVHLDILESDDFWKVQKVDLPNLIHDFALIVPK